jgi:hypothetical protein
MRFVASLLVVASTALSSPTRAEDPRVHVLPGVRARAALDLAVTGSGVVVLESEGPGDPAEGSYIGRSGPALGAEVRGGYVHDSGAGAELRVGVAGLSVLERARRANTPRGAEVEAAILVEAGLMLSFGRAFALPRTAIELRGEIGIGYARVLRDEASGVSLLFGADVGLFVTPRFGIQLGVGYRWFVLPKPDELRGAEVFVRLGPTIRFP